MDGLMDDQRKKSAGDEHVGSKAATHLAGAERTGSRQHARVVAAFASAVTPRIAARPENAPRLRAFVPVCRRPARPPVLRQDYGRRPHRCLQSGRITSRRP